MSDLHNKKPVEKIHALSKVTHYANMSKRCIFMKALPNRSLVTNVSYECAPITLIIGTLKVFTNVACNSSVWTTNRYLKSCSKKKPLFLFSPEIFSNGLSLVLMKEIPIPDNKKIPPITKGILNKVSEKIPESFPFLRSKI